jgi:hypothetical protein
MSPVEFVRNMVPNIVQRPAMRLISQGPIERRTVDGLSTLFVKCEIEDRVNNIPVKGSEMDFIAEIAKKVDLISIMAYLNNVAAIRKKTDPIFQREDILAPIEISLETAPVEEKGISLSSKSYADFEKICSILKQNLSLFSAFSGLAFHDYKNFNRMIHKN